VQKKAALAKSGLLPDKNERYQKNYLWTKSFSKCGASKRGFLIKTILKIVKNSASAKKYMLKMLLNSLLIYQSIS